MIGIFAAAVAAVGWGTDAVLARQGLRQIPPALGTFLSLCAGLCGCLVLLVIVDPRGLTRYPLSGYLWFAAVGVINFLVGRQSNYNATKRLGATRAVPIFAISPLVSIAVAVAVTHEHVNALLLVGVALIVGGMLVVLKS